MAYTVELKPSARAELGKLPQDVQRRIVRALVALGENPRPPGVKKLKGYVNRWRIRVGDYRVLYEIHDRILFVLVVKIGHRSDVYE